MKKRIIVCMILSIFLLSGCFGIAEKCKEAAKIDYGIENPKCNMESVGFNPISCACVEYICKEKSCDSYDYVTFDIKKKS